MVLENKLFIPQKKNKKCPCEGSLWFQRVTWLSWLGLVLHYTICPHSCCLVWNLSEGQIVPALCLIVVYKSPQIFPRLYLVLVDLLVNPKRHTGPCRSHQTPAITFLHCCLSGNAASSYSSIFLHLRCHFRNLWYSPLLTVHSILGPSIHGMNVLNVICGCLCGLSVTSGLCSWSELDRFSWLFSISSSWVDTVAPTWAELFIALGMLGLYQNWVGPY